MSRDRLPIIQSGKLVDRLDLNPDMNVVVNPDTTSTTTTFHFGRSGGVSICGEVGTGTDTTLSKAINEMGRRLCTKCARLVAEWASVGLEIAAARALRHPDR
ncbi:MAG: hypothetical protein OEW30_18925 [Acidimicrobiia bacterium]|nr:hypothetical protein [Acidimicrobiia bacterium]